MTSSSKDFRRFVDRVAIVTGAAQGIGLACARRLGSEGAQLVVVDKACDAVREAVAQLTREGIDAVSVCADLSFYHGAEEAVEAAISNYGGVDVLVNNVGGTIWTKPFWFYTEEEINLEIQRSFTPPLWCCRAVIPTMIKRGRGSIVNIGSAATSSVYRIPYSMSKGGVDALTTSLAVELADFGIRVNCLTPGGTAIEDRKTPRELHALTEDEARWRQQFYDYVGKEPLIPGLAEPEDQAAAVAFLASDEASYITGEIVSTGRTGMSIARGIGCLPDLPA